MNSEQQIHAGGRACLVAIFALGLALALIGLAPAAAGAAPGVSSARVAGGDDGFWTAARMRAAVPLDAAAPASVIDGAATLPNSIAAAEGEPLSVPPAGAGAATPAARAGVTAARPHFGIVGNPSLAGVRMHGRVFFKIPGAGLASCSGTAIRSNRSNLVLTAGHCVNGGGHSGDWYRKWIFVPAYHDGHAPFGVWRANHLYATPVWVEFGDASADVGLATVGRRKGRSLQGTVGARGIRFGGDPDRKMLALGYPANTNDGFNGESERYCLARFDGRDHHMRHRIGPATISMPCNMTEGASGGGWIDRRGFAVSLSSYFYPRLEDRLFGPYFGSLARELYEATQERCNNRVATIVGTSKGERIRGTSHRDVVNAGGGNDRVTGLGKRDVLCGGPGNDRLGGGEGGDSIYGGDGNDRLDGGPGHDFCSGGAGRNRGSGCERSRGLVKG